MNLLAAIAGFALWALYAIFVWAVLSLLLYPILGSPGTLIALAAAVYWMWNRRRR